MEQIISREDYVSRIRKVKERYKTVDTNCLIPGGAMEPWIAAGQLWAEEIPGGLEIYVNEGTYLTLYYHLGEGEEFPCAVPGRPGAEERNAAEEETAKSGGNAETERTGVDCAAHLPVIIEETFRAGSGEGRIRAMEPKLLAAGFVKYRENLMFAVDPGKYRENLMLAANPGVLQRHSITLTEEMTPDRAEQVIALWDRYLECGDIPLDHRNFLNDDTQKVLCAVTEDGTVAGTWWWTDSRRGACEGRHLVTLPEYRGMGIGSALLAGCMERLSERGIRQLSTWINRTNEISVRLHERMGFRQNGRCCIQYIRDTH